MEPARSTLAVLVQSSSQLETVPKRREQPAKTREVQVRRPGGQATTLEEWARGLSQLGKAPKTQEELASSQEARARTLVEPAMMLEGQVGRLEERVKTQEAQQKKMAPESLEEKRQSWSAVPRIGCRWS